MSRRQLLSFDHFDRIKPALTEILSDVDDLHQLVTEIDLQRGRDIEEIARLKCLARIPLQYLSQMDCRCEFGGEPCEICIAREACLELYGIDLGVGKTRRTA